MTLRPPTFRMILALLGASLVLWGAKGEVLNIPGLQQFSLFAMNHSAAWVLVIATVAVVMLAWFRPALFAWLGWCVAVASLAWLHERPVGAGERPVRRIRGDEGCGHASRQTSKEF